VPPPNSQTWTHKSDAALTACVEKGMSRSQVAAAINQQFGTSYTRSAVSGRMDRLGLKTQPSGSPKGFFAHRVKRKARPPAPVPLRRPMRAATPQTAARRVPLVRLENHHCRAIVEERGADGLAVFCGAEKLDGSSYCYAHHEAYHRRAGQ